MMEFYVPVLLMSIVAALAYLVLRLCITLNQKHFTAAWLYYANALLCTFYLIPFYKLLAYLDSDFISTANNSIEAIAATSPFLTVIQHSITYPLEWKEGSTAILHEAGLADTLLFELLPCILAVGSAAFIAVILFRNIAFHRRISTICELADDPLILTELAACSQKLGIRKDIPVYLSPYSSTPFLYGVFRPRIVLPATMEFSAEQYHQVFLHELTHYKRHDILLKCVLIAVNALHWFNPFAYLARRDIERYCELSCDEQIVQYMNEAERKRYCALLLGVLWNVANQKGEVYSAFSNQRKYLERRIDLIWGSEIYKRKRSVRVVTIAVVLSVACIGTALAYNGGQSDSAPIDGVPKSAASKAGTYVPSESILLEGEVGATVRKGDLIFERIESDSPSFPEQADAILANTSQSHLIKESEGNEYCTLWIRNEGSRPVILSVTKGSPTGTVVPGSIVKIPAQTTWSISTINSLPAGDYYANFTSGQAVMSGQVAFTFTKK